MANVGKNKLTCKFFCKNFSIKINLPCYLQIKIKCISLQRICKRVDI